MFNNATTQSTSTHSNAGFLLIDALVGLGVGAILCVTFLSTIFHAQVASTVVRDRFLASLGILETYEVAVSLATEDYAAFENSLTAHSCYSAPCSFDITGTSWDVQSGDTTLNGRFTISFTADTVGRDTSDDIVLSGGSTDSDTTALTITATWTSRGDNYTEAITTYLHNFDF